LSGNGELALTGARDKTAILWETKTGKPLRTLKGHQDDVWAVALSKDGKRALTGSSDQTAILWNAETGEKIRTFRGSNYITCVSMTTDGKRVLTSSHDGAVHLWDTATGKELCRLISFDAGIDWLVVTPDGYFDGSKNASKFASYRVSGSLDFVPLDEYRKQFERPGLLAKVFRGEDYH